MAIFSDRVTIQKLSIYIYIHREKIHVSFHLHPRSLKSPYISQGFLFSFLQSPSEKRAKNVMVIISFRWKDYDITIWWVLHSMTTMGVDVTARRIVLGLRFKCYQGLILLLLLIAVFLFTDKSKALVLWPPKVDAFDAVFDSLNTVRTAETCCRPCRPTLPRR